MKRIGKPFFIYFGALVLSALLLAPTIPALAVEITPETFDARAMALGGAARSLPAVGMSARMNPAAISPIRGFYGGATYLTQNEDILDALRVTVVDNESSPIAGALQYNRMVAHHQESEDVGLTLATGAKGQWWGATVRYVHARDNPDDDWDGAFVGDAGILLKRPGNLRIALVGHDLFASTVDFLETRLALGISAAWDAFTLSADVVRHIERSMDDGQDLMVGIEFAPKSSKWSLRMGQVWEGESADDAFSAGFGWSLDTLEVGYAWRKSRQDPGPTTHVFTIRGAF